MARIRGPQDLNQNTPYNRPIFEVDQSTARVQGPNRGAIITNQTPVAAAPETVETETTTLFPVKRPDEPKESFMDKIVSGVNKVFTLQDTNPEAYNRILSGLDLYKRGQDGDDIATALLGNSQFKKEQAQALFDASLKALDFQESTIKVQEAQKKLGKVDEPSADLQKMSTSILDTQYDIKDEGVAFAMASRAKELQAQFPGIGSGTALNFAIQSAVDSGELISGKGKFGKGKFKPVIGKSFTLEQLQNANPGLSEEEIREQAKTDGVTIL
tara:strand:- start:212 stop:1024 length:813 start_codon:yes stop_codon:yes gene_type:complete